MRHLELRAGLYRDSVRLMQISAALLSVPGVERALVAMATGLNLELLPAMGFDAPKGAGPNDMLVALVATDDATMASVLDTLEVELAGPQSTVESGGPLEHHRTTGTAAADATLALVSTPGRSAFVEAMDALDAGLSVMVFSDNVPVEQEICLKETAARRGLLVMGPDCGTAVIGGVGLGFANVVRPGPVGLVAASGTGAQQVMSLLAWAGVGVSHCLGVGGRDLSAAVGGLSTHAALDALDADPTTELIVLIGKPPAPDVAAAVRAHADRLGTRVVMAPLGAGQPDLTSAVATVLRHLGQEPPESWPQWPAAAVLPDRSSLYGGASDGYLRGLFSGGTLCVEAMAIAAETLGPIHSNIPLRPEWTLGSPGHSMIDLGDDEYTVGRPHPMIDPGPRLERIAAAAADPACRVLLLDVVLGHAAHPDPAASLAPAIRAARAVSTVAVVVALVGTPDDPQDVSRQAADLSGAGASVFTSNAQAARHAVSIVAGRSS